MAALIILVGLVVIVVLAPFFGVDSRVDDERDRRGWWPGAPRSR